MRTIVDRPAVSAAIIAQLRTTLREVRCMSGDRMRRSDVSYTQFHIVSILERHGDMPMSRLADMLDVSLSNASGLVDRLEDRGLVERIRVHADRRVVLVRATEGGRHMIAEVEILKDDMLQRVIDRLDDAQLARAAHALRDIRDAAMAAFAADPTLGRHEHLHEHATDAHHRSDHSHPALDPAPSPAPIT